jgi:hypothetical protein
MRTFWNHITGSKSSQEIKLPSKKYDPSVDGLFRQLFFGQGSNVSEKTKVDPTAKLKSHDCIVECINGLLSSIQTAEDKNATNHAEIEMIISKACDGRLKEAGALDRITLILYNIITTNADILEYRVHLEWYEKISNGSDVEASTTFPGKVPTPLLQITRKKMIEEYEAIMAANDEEYLRQYGTSLLPKLIKVVRAFEDQQSILEPTVHTTQDEVMIDFSEVKKDQ